MKLDQESLDRIAEEFSEAIRKGRNPSVDDFVARHGGCGELHQLLTSVKMIEGIKRDTDHSTASAPHEKLSVTELDDYKIVREIGRGGMGMVFEAFDQSLHRRVAIKVLPNNLLSDARNLERFRSEAKAAARLRHPNIVSVFGVGHANDHHYFVMDYIDGINLREWLRSVSEHSVDAIPTRDAAVDGSDGSFSLHGASNSALAPVPDDRVQAVASAASIPALTDHAEYFRWVARVGMMISDALQYAHSQNTLHRDIKPANLLIDRDGTVSITDFGLAKVAEQQGVTRTGDVVGTPQYMAPESFEGNYDAKSDTYSVGLTIYELLTLRPAVPASSPAEAIRKAVEGVNVEPRKWNQDIPRELETIVLKTLARQPDHRYASARALRDDLNCFLHDMPISAKRSTLIERVVRWSRREPVVASLTLVTFASLLAMFIVSATAYFRTSSALSRAEESGRATVRALDARSAALESAQEQRNRAEANLSVAIKAFDQIRERIWQRGTMPDAEILGEIADSSSTDVSQADAQILQSLLGFFDELAANNSSDLRSESAAAARRAGDIYQRLGQLDQANRAYSDASDRYRSLAETNPENADYLIEQARILNEQIVTASLLGQVQRASLLFDQNVDLLSGSPLAMESDEGKFEFARTHILFASILSRAGLDSPVRIFRSGGRSPRRPGINNSIHLRLGEELQAAAKGVEVLTELVDQHPDDSKFKVALARAYRDQSKVAARAGRPANSEEAVKRSIDLFESMLAENQDSESIQYELAKTLSSSEALSLNQTFRILRAEKLSESLLERSPDLPRYQALRAHVLESLATRRSRIIGKRDAESILEEALDLYDALIRDAPDYILYRTKKSQTLELYADIKLRNGERQEAIDRLEQAIAVLQVDGRTVASPAARMQTQKQRQKLNRIIGSPR